MSQKKYRELKDYVARARRASEVDSKIQVILGIAYVQQEDYSKAKQAFETARRLDSNNPEPLLAQASLAMSNNKLDEVRKFIDVLRPLASGSPDLWMLEGDLNMRLNNRDLALAAYNNILQKNPDYVSAKIRRARILLDQGDLSTVISDLEPLWEQELYEPEAIYLYATALARSGDTVKATQVLEEASRKIDYLGANLVEKHPTLALLSAIISFKQGDLLKALESCKKLVEKLPNHAPSRMLLAKIYTQMDQAENVIATLRPIYFRSENDPDFLTLYGKAQLQLEQYEAAISSLERAAELSKDAKPLLSDIALAKIAMGETDNATKDLRTAFDEGKSDTKSGVLLAYTQISAGEIDNAEKTAESLLQTDQENPVLHNLMGTIAAAKGNHMRARRKFSEALRFDPAYTPALMNLIKIDMREGKLDEARIRLEALLADQPDSLQAMKGLAQIAENLGDYESAALWLEKLWAKHPDAIGEVLQLIILYQRMAQLDKALTIALRLREKNPKNFEVLITLINTQLGSGKRQDAIDTINRSLRYTIDFDINQLLELAKKQIQVEDTEGAYSTLSKCLIQEPGYIPAKVELLKLETQLRNYEKALTLADEIINALKDLPLGYSLRADVLVFANRNEEAIEIYEWTNSQWPSTQLFLKILQQRQRLGKSKGALKPLEQWARSNPEDIEAQFGLAVGYIDVGEYDKAISMHEKLLKFLPDNASIHNNLAWLLQNGNLPGALKHAKKAFELSPEDPDILDTFGWVLAETGQLDEGLSYIRQALSRSSKEPAARYHLALVLNKMNRKNEALETLRELLKSHLDFRELGEAKALLSKLEK